MKTPDKIKKGLELHTDFDESCVGKGCPFAGGEAGEYCVDILARDALAYIRQLEQQNAGQAARISFIKKMLMQVMRERDAAIRDLRDVIEAADGVNYCQFCKHNEEDGQCHHPCNPYGGESGWEWRGVPPKQCETCTNNGWDMPQCKECNAENGYKWYREWAEHE